MHFEPSNIYHVYNRGNDKQTIFFKEENYLYFQRKISTEWKKFCDILCYCLMPNHFHFMLVPNKEGCNNILLNGRETHMQNLSKTIGKTLSSYTQAINIQNRTTGNLFQKKTKSKLLEADTLPGLNINNTDYLLTCFHYIHQNPKFAKIVADLKDWPHSSYLDYFCQRDGNICNKNLAFDLLGLHLSDFVTEQYPVFDNKIIESLF